MSAQSIENHICEALTGDAQRLVLDFASHLKNQNMQFERGTGYWEDKRYWHIKYKDKYVCFLLINGFGSARHKDEPEGWIVWSDDSGEDWFRDYPLEERFKEISWSNVDICGKCGGCSIEGTPKTVFGKNFDDVCRTTFRFDNPDTDAVECLKKLVKIRKNDIDERFKDEE
ncbi:MAG: hypothetical protein LBL09_02250 [Oscillospiraceae bacterium]|jgi:hypothetical protein|nr:hypothetical protein [Oscillospiraceae bacterium]